MSKRAKIITGAAVAVVAVAVAGILWWSLRGDGPEAVDIRAAVAQLEATVQDGSGDSVAGEPEADGSPDPDTGSEVSEIVADPEEAPRVAPETAVADKEPPPNGAETAVDSESGASEGSASEGSASEAVESEDTASEATIPPSGDSGSSGPESGEGEDVLVESSPSLAVDDSSSTAVAGETETSSVPPASESEPELWRLIRTEGADALASEGAVSFAGFRVEEVLAGGLGENTAVGRTADVRGYIQLAETALIETKVLVEMGSVRTDDSHRDYHMREVLDTENFPLAAFVLVEPVELPAGSFDGQPFSGTVLGDLTIKGVTNRVEFDIEAQLVDDVIVVVGSSEVVFSDFGVPTPSSASVLSVDDDGIMEFQLYFSR